MVPLGGLEPPPHGLRARHAALTLQRGVELIPGIEPGHRPYHGRRLPLHQISVGANGGIRTRTSRLGRPAGDRYPTLALVRPTGIEPVPPRWQRGMLPAHPGRTWTGIVHRPIDVRRLSKTPLLRAATPVLATAPGFEPGPASVGDSDASVTPRCRRHDFTVFEDRTSLCPRARVSRARSPIKKAF